MPRHLIHRQVWAASVGIGQACNVNVFWIVLAVVVCGALVYLGYAIEPHYASKDGHRFLCIGQMVSGDHQGGRKREVRISVLPDGVLQMDVKRGLRRTTMQWSIEAKIADPPPRRAVYLLRRQGDDGTTERMAIRLPATSRAVATLDQAMTKSG
jgi:hypothetical protein